MCIRDRLKIERASGALQEDAAAQEKGAKKEKNEKKRQGGTMR